MNYDWDFSVFVHYIPAFKRAIWITIKLSVYSSFWGTIIGVFLGVIYRVKPLNYILLPINDILRAIPVLVLMFFFYYFPYVEIFNLDKAPSSFFCATLALTLAQAVFTADVVRAAIDGVSNNTILGAQALGLKQRNIWHHIILPDVFRQILPTMIAFYIGNVRLSSLASVIGTEDSVYVAKIAITQNFRSLEAWIIVALIYIALVLPLSIFSRFLEKSKWLKRRS